MNITQTSRRRLLLVGIAATSLSSLSSGARAARNETMHFYVIVAAGGSVDAMARIVGDKLGPLLGTTVVVENKPGGGGNLATITVARAAPDGNSLLVTANNHTLNPILYKDAGYRIDDLLPIGELMEGPSVVVVPPASPYKSLDQLIADARQRPGAISYGTAGIGTPSHVAAELFLKAAGIRLESVPYRGSGPSLADLAGGQIPVAVSSLVAAMPLIRSGRIRALAVTSAKRWPGAEDIPTAAEFGMPGFEHVTWIGLFAPRGTPPERIRQLSDATQKVLADPEVQKKVAALGGEVGRMDAAAFATFVEQDFATAREIVTSSGMKAE